MGGKTKRLLTPLYLDPEQKEALKRLSAITRVPMSVYMREAVDDLLVKYRKELKKEPRK